MVCWDGIRRLVVGIVGDKEARNDNMGTRAEQCFMRHLFAQPLNAVLVA